ncbi:MAG: HAD family phosphatase [Candidatus Sericytochromatia bacterium]
MYKAVLFDFDGLIVDSEPIYVEANKRFLREKGVTDFSIMSKLFGMRAEETFQLMKDTFNFQESVEDLMNIRNSYILDDFANGKLNLMKGLRELIDYLKNNNYKVAIGSSSKWSLLSSGMKVHNIEHLFDLIVCGDDVQNGKPEPDIYLKAAEKLNVLPNECIVLEDAPNGVLAGKRAGMLTISVPNHQTKDLKFPEHDYISEDLFKVIDIIKSLEN